MLLREPAWRPTSNMDSSAENNLAVKHKTVKFYKNGDRFFRGHQVSITDRRYRSFDNLLSELTRVTKLPHGVRFVFSPQTGRRVHNLEELENGKSYVCASNGRLTKMDYGGSSIKLSDSNSSKDAAFSRKAKMNVRLKPLNHVETNHKSTKNSSSITVSKALAIKPRLITVIRNGHKPRQVVKILLNRRTAQSFEQVLDDITSSVGVEGGSGVRKLYSSDGKPVQGLSDLLNNEAEVFIAVGREKFNVQDISDILKDGNLHSDRGKVKNRTKKVDLDSSISIRTKNYENKNNHEETVDDIVSPKSKEDRLKTDNKLAKRLGIVHRRGSKGETVSKQTPSSKKVHLPALHGEVNNVSTKTEDLNSATVLPSIIKNDSNSDKIDDTVRPTEPPVSNQLPDIPGSPEDFDSLKDLKDDIKDVYDFGKKLGDGNFAVVREVTHKMNRKHYALKIIDRSKIRGKEAMLENEIRIMKQCKHSNIVKLYDDLHSSNEIFLVMELVSGGDLFDAISSAIRFAEPVAANCLHDICSALGYLHKQNIVHRDLKPENVLVSEQKLFSHYFFI